MKEAVFLLVKVIPRGKVSTYGQIAEKLGDPKLARAVGNILHRNPDPEHIPCHRVVNRLGCVSENYAFGGAAAQRALLISEGIEFDEQGRIDLDRFKA